MTGEGLRRTQTQALCSRVVILPELCRAYNTDPMVAIL